MVVDREGYFEVVIEEIYKYLLIEVICDEIIDIFGDVIIVIVIGLLISDSLVVKIYEFNGGDGFYFYDVVVLIVDKNMIDINKVYFKFRYDKGEVVYLNCLMIKEEFMVFYEVLIIVEEVLLNFFEKEKYFEGCMFIEVMVKCGIKMMFYGLMKLVGLEYFEDYKGL